LKDQDATWALIKNDENIPGSRITNALVIKTVFINMD